MKILILILSLISTCAFAADPQLGQANYPPALKRMIELQNLDGQKLQRKARATWDYDRQGGASTEDLKTGVFLPAKAIITRSYIYVKTQQTSAGAATTAVFCEDANNIKTATDITGEAAGALVEGQSTGAASAFVGSIAAQCEIKVRFAVFPVSSGKFNVFVDYIVTD